MKLQPLTSMMTLLIALSFSSAKADFQSEQIATHRQVLNSLVQNYRSQISQMSDGERLAAVNTILAKALSLEKEIEQQGQVIPCGDKSFKTEAQTEAFNIANRLLAVAELQGDSQEKLQSLRHRRDVEESKMYTATNKSLNCRN